MVWGMPSTQSQTHVQNSSKRRPLNCLEKDAIKNYTLYKNIEELTKELFHEIKGPDAHIAANVDLYSGFVYEMLGIPYELYTPLFATARIAGWCAHRIEQIVSDQKIIRPALRVSTILWPTRRWQTDEKTLHLTFEPYRWLRLNSIEKDLR